ncbi:RagB/SusD family nutrient uptake outer membrane protein [Olivibacter sp. SDN3]|uniref:RagB/SusD family nutrient uptake outer membrane protein n=1 Tax=Olivibacter sp. SDN3 TaxID=2764720 RepID=UPI0016511FFD|nr:RagB/SusD family nutrient uptake outer membrane protein [Olivibacter sp. SDN3]QNL51540.1 RagB/SusD family nutrient uptake outer membrane protein [Olivibacter sp. SDN3]
MTNQKVLLLFFSLSSLWLTACSDRQLEVIPRDRLSDATIWTDAGTADLFLNDIYNNLPDGNNWEDPFENYSDNSMSGFSWASSRNLEQESSYTPAVYPAGTLNIYWDTNYGHIRKCNVFIDKVTSAELPEEYKSARIAEARFLRAYFYHILWMAYGGVPLITEPLDRLTQEDAIFRPRASAEETALFIIDELDAASQILQNTNELGRATKGAALTLKGWVELYYASPLYNEGNLSERWLQAAATNREVIDLGLYALYPEYGTLFLPEGNNNQEGIFFRQYFPRLKGGRETGLMGTPYTLNGGHTSWGAINPTQDLVDDYAMANGKPISDPSSGYDPQNPYANRELRFYESIVYDGSYWYNDTIYTRLGVNSPNALDLSDASDATNTAYNLRKRMNPNIPLGADNWDGATSNQHYYYFRFAEVLLSYAEAQNEAVGPDPSVYEAINSVRERNPADPYLPPLQDGLSQQEMREVIRRERRVELAFEDKRRWDMLRWKTAEQIYSEGLHAMRIERQNGQWQYTVVQAPGGRRNFSPKNYFFPIPQQVLDQNEVIRSQNGGPDNLSNGQNPGY